VELEPRVYRCATHEVDLTELVREQVAERLRVLDDAPEDDSFRVVVTCPGGRQSPPARL
jgi:hypothetical protein